MHRNRTKAYFLLLLLFLFPGMPFLKAQRMYADLYEICQKMEKEAALLPATRKDTLRMIGDTLLKMIQQRGQGEILFAGITDGSLTQLAQVWFYTALSYHKVKNIKVYSGGLRPDAINYRIVAALKRTGYNIQPVRGYSENPVYFFNLGRSYPDYTIFAKAIDYHNNPHEGYLVVPVNPQVDHLDYGSYGAATVIPYHWQKPDIWNDTPVEVLKYDEFSRQIGRDMFFLACYIDQQLRAQAKGKKAAARKKRKK